MKRKGKECVAEALHNYITNLAPFQNDCGRMVIPYIRRIRKERVYFSRKTFRRSFFLKIVAYHIMHIHKHHSTHIVSIRIHAICIHSISIHSRRIYQYVSIQYVSTQHVSLHIIASAGMVMSLKLKTFPCISWHQQEWQ